MAKKIHNMNLVLKVSSLSEFEKQNTFKKFMSDSQKNLFAKIAQNIEKELLRSTEKEIPNIYRPIVIQPIRKAFLREPFIFKVGGLHGIDELVCILTGKKILKGNECILFVIKTEEQGYVLSAAIEKEEDFNKLLKIGSITEYLKTYKTAAPK